ncbi:MAG: hypothetical protein L6R40_002431 [Gallowayella cf. fulva]|nr:MAG: hypothetical protein L6R40_002431 [Xanthomendoza cf. fulva]
MNFCNTRLINVESDALAGHSWYSVVGGGNDRASPIMGVSFVPSQQKGQVDYQLNASSSYQHGRRLSTASHTRTSSSSSTTSSMQSPPSSTVPYGLSPPSYLMRYPQVPVATGGFLPASMPPPPDTFNFLPAPAMMQPYGPGFGHPVDFGSSPAVYSQASLTRPRQEPRQHQIIIQNLSVDVKEMWLKDFLATSVGPVQMSIIEERGDKKRHAFVSFTHAEHANLAVIRFDGQLIAGRKVSVRLTKEKEALEIQNGPLVVDGSVEE